MRRHQLTKRMTRDWEILEVLSSFATCRGAADGIGLSSETIRVGRVIDQLFHQVRLGYTCCNVPGYNHPRKPMFSASGAGVSCSRGGGQPWGCGGRSGEGSLGSLWAVAQTYFPPQRPERSSQDLTLCIQYDTLPFHCSFVHVCDDLFPDMIRASDCIRGPALMVRC